MNDDDDLELDDEPEPEPVHFGDTAMGQAIGIGIIILAGGCAVWLALRP